MGNVGADIFKSVTLVAASGLPVVGGPASTVLSMIYGAEDQSPAIWDAVKDRVAQAIKNDRIEASRKELKRSLEDIKGGLDRLQTYQGQAYTAELTSLENDVEQDKSKFMKDGEDDDAADIFYSLPFFTQWANMHLGLLKTKIDWAKKNDDPDQAAYEHDYRTAAREYALYAYYGRDAALQWRASRIDAKDGPVYTTQGGGGRLGVGERRVPSGKYWARYRDAENPDDDFDASGIADASRAGSKRASVLNGIREAFEATVGQTLHGWVEREIIPNWPSADGQDRIKAGQILAKDEKIQSPNKQYTFRVGIDTAELVDAQNNFIWMKRFKGQSLFVAVEDPGTFTIWSGQPHRPGRQLWAATTETYPHAWLRVQDDGNLCVYQGDPGYTDGHFRWGTIQELRKVKESAKLTVSVDSVKFAIVTANEHTSPLPDDADLDRLSLNATVQGQAEQAVVSWSTKDDWEVSGGEEKVLNSNNWRLTLAPQDKGKTITFRAYVREYDSWSANESYDATMTVKVSDLWNNAVALAGATYEQGATIHVWGDEVKMDVTFDIKARVNT